MRHGCSVTPRLRSPGRKRHMTASRVRNSAMGSDSENARMGSAFRATGPSDESSADIIHHRVPQNSYTRDFNFDHIPRREIAWWVEARAGAAGRAAKNHVARLERAESRQVADQMGNREQHAVTGVVLALFSIHASRYPQGRRTHLVSRHDVRADRTRAIEVLPLRHVKFRVTQPIADRPLVAAGVAEHRREGRFRLDPAAARADHNDNLALIIELRGLQRPDNRLAKSHQRRMGPHEQARILRPLAAVLVFLVPLGVVDSDAEVARIASNGLEDLHIRKRIVILVERRDTPPGTHESRTNERQCIGDVVSQPRTEVNDSVRPQSADGLPTFRAKVDQFQAARSSSNPTRFRTASRRRSNSGVAGTIGRRCSLTGNSPSRFIMYFIGIGFVSKNTAWLISKSW